MIHGFVRQSGGQVRIYSEPDQGTTVCLYLPRHCVAEVFQHLGHQHPHRRLVVDHQHRLALPGPRDRIHGFVRQSGGQVRIYSEPDQGTTVCLYLPRHYGAADDVDDGLSCPGPAAWW
jgi:hypothetical protein